MSTYTDDIATRLTRLEDQAADLAAQVAAMRLNEEEIDYLHALLDVEGRSDAVMCAPDTFNLVVSILEKLGCTSTADELREIRADQEPL